MNRRNFIRHFILTLLYLAFGDSILELLDPEELEAFVADVDRRMGRQRVDVGAFERALKELYPMDASDLFVPIRDPFGWLPKGKH